MTDHPEARQMMIDSEVALKPVLEKYKHLVHPKVWEQYEDGCVSGTEVIEHTFYRHNLTSSTLSRLPIAGTRLTYKRF